MTIPRFDYVVPATFDEALAAWQANGEDARYFSGGTALMLLMRAQLLFPSALISLACLPGMRGIAREGDVLRIGALTTHTEVATSTLVRSLVPMLSESFGHIATRRVRNVATIGGNLAHANPHQDPPTSLMAADAGVVVRGPGGERRVPLTGLFVDYLQTSLEPGEIITAIEVPVPAAGTGMAFIKHLPRSADDYATVNVAVSLKRVGGRIERARVVVGSMGPTPVRARETEKMIEGQMLSAALAAEASQGAVAGLDPEFDFRGSPEYKLRVTPVIVRRALLQAWDDPAQAAVAA